VIAQHGHQWVPWDEHRLSVCDGDDGCTAAIPWDGPTWDPTTREMTVLDWTDLVETSVTDVPDRVPLVEQIKRQVFCRAGLHDWCYFIDGSICRCCSRCPRVQYDLPGVRS
jgi:hypothetical protein